VRFSAHRDLERRLVEVVPPKQFDQFDPAGPQNGKIVNAGSITIAEISGSADVKSGSGKIEIGRVGADTRVTTGAGDIEVGEAGDSVEAFTAAGAVKVRRADHGRVRAKTMAGRVSVGVAKGSAAYLDISTMSGRVHSELDAAEPPADGDKRVELIIRTMSGDVNLARA
jgi:DUF4097 and DUF4098 domain-containing protein YvlB